MFLFRLLHMLIDVLRHGEPLGGARYRGHTDDTLSNIGKQQMSHVLRATLPWTHIISSPLKRCSDFSNQLSKAKKIPLQIDPRFTEIDFGDWEGLTSEQIMAHDAEHLARYWQDPEHNTPPNGETLLTFKTRVLEAWQECLSADKTKHLLIVTHGGVLRIIFSHALAMPCSSLFNINVPYACLSRFEQTDTSDPTQLVFHHSRLP